MTKRSRCKKCGDLGVKVRNPQTGYRQLFQAIRVAGQIEADMSKPHVCSGPKIDTEAVRRIVQDELKLWSPTGQPSTSSTSTSEPTAAASSIPAVSREEIQKAVEAAVAARVRPTVERIVVMRDAAGEEKTAVTGHTHPLFARLMRYIKSGVNVYLYGAPGGGKSHAAMQVAEALGRRYGYISLAPMTPESRVVGFLGVNGEFVHTEFFKCYTEGGVFCIDEMDNANDALLTALNGALENKRAAFPNGVFNRSGKFSLVATGNTAGYGGTRGHAGRRAFDSATRERFAYIRWTYDEALEQTLTLQANPAAEPWLAWVRAARTYCAANFPDTVVSPRASIRGAEMLKDAAVESAEELADALVFKGLEEVQRAKILINCPLPQITITSEEK